MLTTQVARRDAEKKTQTAGDGAGAEAFFDELFEEIEPDMGAVDFDKMCIRDRDWAIRWSLTQS